ncbi:MAG: HPr kinase/phosphorylase [Elusimicrobia bacterium]|nr:HPr kinase/phosphorylase [Elusimicrobiota bacterium]
MSGVTVKEFLKEKQSQMKLKLLAGAAALDKKITVFDVNRPGLALAGYFKYFAFERIQVMGMTELSYLAELDQKRLQEILERLFSYDLVCFVITRSLEPPQELIKLADEREVAVLRTPLNTITFINEVTTYLEEKFAPTTSVHGVLIDVYGVGTLILGESGIGKSECALELVKRGHRLVADDVVDIRRKSSTLLIGKGMELIKYHMEIRGLGIIDIRNLFGAGAIRNDTEIDLIIQMEEWDSKREYDRLGLDEITYEILGVEVPKLVIPIRPGRNIAAIVEVAAMNWRLKKTGYFSAHEFDKKLKEKTQQEQ